jgi:cellulose synthase/poly-beta-1,6-N-acetylglucosamine synthase-like glycosyltransferase
VARRKFSKFSTAGPDGPDTDTQKRVARAVRVPCADGRRWPYQNHDPHAVAGPPGGHSAESAGIGSRVAATHRRVPRRVLIAGFTLALTSATVLMAIRSTHFLYALYVAVSLLVGAVGLSTLIWMLHAWRTPDALTESHLKADGREPAHSFSLIVPARHEEAVLETTLSRLISSDHPDVEVLVVVGADDPGTREVAERIADRHPERIRVIIDPSWPKSKPKALNAALPYCSGSITGVFDAEDDVHPALLRRVDQCFQVTDADIVQAGVQLMNFRSSWLTVHNVLEYYFWFRSRLHVHARQRFIPLGGNTVFIRTSIVRAVSGWSDCLAEDCEIGVRLSALGARTAVFYEPELVTREECPPTLRAFTRQRTRWNQGYLQTVARGYWWRLPPRQRALGVYILASPYVMALAWLMIPAAIATAVAVKAPIVISLLSFLPLVPMLCMLVAEVVGLGEFCRTYEQRPSVRDYLRLVLGLPLYQCILAYAAARAVVREARAVRGWEKTAHLGLHLAQSTSVATQPVGAAANGREPHPVAYTHTQRRPIGVHAAADLGLGTLSFTRLGCLTAGSVSSRGLGTQPSGGVGNGKVGWPLSLDHLYGVIDQRPLWAWIDSAVSEWVSPTHPDTSGQEGRESHVGSRLAAVRAALARLLRSHTDIAVQVPLLIAVGFVLATNMFHWPAVLFDEGTYVGNAWAVGERGELAFYTYTYGHPPLAWLLITIWTSVGGLFGHVTYSLDGSRELACVVTLVGCSLLFTLARRLGMSRPFAVLAVLLFALSPLSMYFHRGTLLDNPATVWAIAAFALALSPRRKLWSFAESGACFAASVLSKETTLVILPALLLAAFQNADLRTRRYCVALLVTFFALVLAAFPLYATLKGEILPGRGHVSLLGTDVNMVATRQGTGSVLSQGSVGHGTVTFWLSLDPWLVGAALLLSPIALAFRRLRAVTLAYLIQVAMIMRPGYLPAMYVIAQLPFAALIVAGTMQALWHVATADRPGRQIPARQARWPLARARVATVLTKVSAAVSALVVAVAVAVAAIYVVPRWVSADRAAMTIRLDTPQREAENWLIHHVGHEQRLIVTDDFWVYLIGHGYDSRAVKGGFNSPTVVSYWPLDKDPAVRRYFPYSWREFDYIVSTPAMRDTSNNTPDTAEALQHSRVVAAFGQGREAQIQIRRITPTALGSGPATMVRKALFRVRASNRTPSLEQIAHKFHVRIPEIIVQTNWHENSPEWWYYEARHNWKAPLPRGIDVY